AVSRRIPGQDIRERGGRGGQSSKQQSGVQRVNILSAKALPPPISKTPDLKSPPSTRLRGAEGDIELSAWRLFVLKFPLCPVLGGAGPCLIFNLLRHVVTRWLSLLSSIDRILKCWRPLTSYFQSLGEEECSKILWKCFGEDGNEVFEMYFLFLSHILNVFSDSIEALEAKSFSITSVFKGRLKDTFFDFPVNNKLKQLTPDLAKKCEADFLVFYERAKKYVSERYDFSENSFHSKVSKLGLTTAVSYGEYSDAVQACSLKDIDMDGLYEEYGMVEAILSSSEMEGCHSEERYLKLFSKAEVPLVNLRTVSAYIFSIPCSNAHTERVFSMMTSAWRNERNRLDVDSVKAELHICVNFTFECTDMYQRLLTNKNLLEAARKGQKRWEGGDPGVSNQKTPTTILLTPDRKFHSFGYAARDFYHDLDPSESKQWLYLEKFKMKLHTTANLSIETDLHAANGKRVKAIDIFAYALAFFKEQAIKELSDQTGGEFDNNDVRWVITVPAIWKMPAKQFMREAAYKSGLVSRENPEQLIIALEPEAASIYCRKLRLHQMVDLGTNTTQNGCSPTENVGGAITQAKEHVRRNRQSRTFMVENVIGELWAELEEGDRYVVVDCGGGTVDLTKLLCKIFGQDFIDQFKIKRPAAWVDLMIAFESRKTAAPERTNPLNINLPFSFIDYYKKFRGHSVEHALRKSNVDFVKWSSQGMLRMNPDAMNSLFKPTIDHIIQHLTELFEKPEVSDIKFLFLVGGFAESLLLQQAVQDMLQGRSRIIIPHDVGLTILKGAVLFGLDPSIIKVRRSPLTYGVGVLNRFVEGKHPPEKLLVKDGTRWCTDVLDTFIAADQSVALGELVKRSYTPAKPSQQVIVIHVYCSEKEKVGFISEPSVRKCGTLRLDVSGTESTAPRREIQTLMQFGDTEIRAMAVDVSTGRTAFSSRIHVTTRKKRECSV
ncbi:hypothetical protein F7725_024504, partial [Dissostichus mawsoni]